MKTTLTEIELRKACLYLRVQAAKLLERAEKTGSTISRDKSHELCDIAEKLDTMRAELSAEYSAK
jgi:hypothetical protein